MFSNGFVFAVVRAGHLLLFSQFAICYYATSMPLFAFTTVALCSSIATTVRIITACMSILKYFVYIFCEKMVKEPVE
jgi:hypothetical protein